jgi:hypothetical protein
VFTPSDLKALPQPPPWIDERRGRPVLLLYSVVDDRNGVAYQEYHVVYGEEAYVIGQKPVDVETVQNVLAPDLDGLEPRLTRPAIQSNRSVKP